MQQPKKKRTVVRGVKSVSIRPVYRKPMDTELIAPSAYWISSTRPQLATSSAGPFSAGLA
jgi:hypothetical protein